MEMGMLVAEFFLDGCTTLKDKRHRIGGLSDRFGKAQNVAVIESGFQNDHRRSEWTFVAIANNRVGVENLWPILKSVWSKMWMGVWLLLKWSGSSAAEKFTALLPALQVVAAPTGAMPLAGSMPRPATTACQALSL